MYASLKLELITETLQGLARRIEERFPGSGLRRVSGELLEIAEDTRAVIERVSRPRVWLRVAIGIAIMLIVALPLAILPLLDPGEILPEDASSLLQTVESAVQDVIFISIAIYFLLSVEGRLNRHLSLHALRQLRSIVHIVDMHQLTKDPEHLLSPAMRTRSSPKREYTRFELSRYLDYCTELLSIASKLAALHAQHLDDPVVLEAVGDIESLASNLSNRIWQKIMILDTALPEPR